jgi:hypothetical protein
MGMMMLLSDDAFQVLSRQVWRLALAEVPPDDRKFNVAWDAIVRFCNMHGSPPSEKQAESFSDLTDPHDNYPDITKCNHPYLKKLFKLKDR